MPYFSRFLNLFFPAQCLACDGRVLEHGTLCPACWQAMTFLSAPQCARCGLPFEYALGPEACCGECLREMPPFATARAVLRYDDASRALILKLKFQDNTTLAPYLGAWLARAGAEALPRTELIVPVPLHYWRFVKRRYNQAALLARALSRHNGAPVLPDALKRIRATAPQTGLSAKERIKNVRGAFLVHPRRAERISGKNILLIDDVYTTGATLRACTKALLKAGAREVNVLTLARRV